MNFTLTPFDVLFPIGLGALYGLTRYLRLSQAGEPAAWKIAALDGVKGVVGAGAIMLAYKLLGIL
jgi:hypothetical protein